MLWKGCDQINFLFLLKGRSIEKLCFYNRKKVIPGSWWSRAQWRGTQWRTHRTSGSLSTTASSHQGNCKKRQMALLVCASHDRTNRCRCCLLCRCQQHKEANHAVLQRVEVLWWQQMVEVRKYDRKCTCPFPNTHTNSPARARSHKGGLRIKNSNLLDLICL